MSIFHPGLAPPPRRRGGRGGQGGASWVLGTAFALLAIASLTTLAALIQRQRSQVLGEARDELQIIAESKSAELAAWRRQRLADARMLAELLASALLHPSAPATDPALAFSLMLEHGPYASIRLLDRAGAELAAVGAPLASPGFPPGLDPAQAAAQPAPFFTDFARGDDGQVRLFCVGPVRASAGADPVGYVVLALDPSVQLYPMVQHWPGHTRSGESLLVRREGEEVVFLNDPRHRPDAALRLRFPVADRNLPAAAAVRGERGPRESRDYRGVPVVAVATPIPDSPWFLVAKLDADEAFASADLLELYLGAVGVALSFAIALAALQLRGRRAERAQAELQASEERFRRAVVGSPFPIILHAEDGRVLQVSDSWLELTGYSRAELTTISDWTARAYGERHQVVSDYIDHLYALDRAVAEGDYEIRTRAGPTRIWQFSSAPLGRLSDGRRAVISMALDVTDHRAAEAQARLLSHALRQAPISLMITDAQARIEYVNPKFEEVSGYTLDEVRGQNPRLLKSGRTPAALYAEMWRELAAGRQWRGEFENRRKDGVTYWEEAIIAPVRDEAGRTTHYLATKLEVTAQRRDTATIREQAALLDSAGDAIFIRSLDGVVRYWNPAAARTFGRPEAEAVGQPVTALSVATAEQLADENTALVQTGQWSGERTYPARDGRALIVQLRLTLHRGAADQPQVVLAIATDVTEQKQMEARFLQTQRLENLGALASGLAHDLNNVLTPMLMAVAILRRQADSDDTRRLLDTLETSARRGAGIVRQVLTFARGVQGERVPVDLRHLVREMRGIAEEVFPKSITFTTDTPPGLSPVVGDATQLHQVLMNLCINARDAMPAGGLLELRTDNLELTEAQAATQPGAHAGPYVRVRVRDDGTGISPEHLDRIFDPFFSTKPRGQGTGLGLSTVLGIVRSHGGFVNVQSTVGQGSEFTVCLPAAPDRAIATGSDSPLPAPAAAGEGVLVVDDEPGVRIIARQVLANAGYHVFTAQDGRAGLETFREHRDQLTLVVTDIMMPVMDGLELIAAIRILDPHARIVAMTGAGDDAVLQAVQALHPDALLAKPFTEPRLLEAVHAVAVRQPAAHP